MPLDNNNVTNKQSNKQTNKVRKYTISFLVTHKEV